MKIFPAIIDELRKSELPVIIFGANVTAKAVFHACEEYGVKVTGFCDNNMEKPHKSFCGLEVIHTSELKRRFLDALFIIAAIDINDIADQLRAMGYEKFYAGGIFLKDFDYHKYSYDKEKDFVDYVISAFLLSHEHYLNPGRIYLRSVDIVITERCSLKCRDCSNLMQYYKHPENYPLEELMREIGIFLSAVDEINEFRVIGGEPFMNKDWLPLVERLIGRPKVRKVVIFTNGTIVPADAQLESLRSNKILFMVTDYGVLSRNIVALTGKLDELGIACHCFKADGWTDCSNLNPHNRSPAELQEVFNNCCVKNAFTLMKGKLYRCPFSANADRLRAVPEFSKDMVDMTDPALSPDELKQRIRDLVTQKKYIAVCDFCNGRRLDDPKIPPAIQTDNPLDYILN